MKQLIQTTLVLFVCCGIIFIPFPYIVFPYTEAISELLFNDVLLFLAGRVFKLTGVVPHITSDSTLMYLLMLLLFVLACCVALGMRFVAGRSARWQPVYEMGYLTACYYLVLHLMKYGVDKLVKAQFYLPEPNILYTPFGQLDQDILYWSTMGTSYSYNLFLGVAEIITAVLLLFNRTRVVGLLAAWALLLNIVAVNFSFNISVKLFSLFLFFLCNWLLVPYLKTLYRLLVLRQVMPNNEGEQATPFLTHPFWKTTIKTAAVLLIITEAVYPHLHKSSINDDRLARPFLHGAYQVVHDTSAGTSAGIKRLFIHRKGYFIMEDDHGRMKDYQLEIDQTTQQMMITDYRHRQTRLGYTYHAGDSILEITLPGDSRLKAKALNWRALPALQSTFQWTTDAE